MKEFDITGMSCAACSARIEKAVSKMEDVDKVSVNLLTNSMVVDGSASEEEIINTVVDSGYGAKVKGSDNTSSKSKKDELKDEETPKMIKRLILSLVFLAPLMYVSMGHTMWGWWLPSILENNYVAIALIEFILATIVMIINKKFFISGVKGVIHKAPNMDTLVALGSGASYIYSTVLLFMMTNAVSLGDMNMAAHYLHDLYFESAAMILALITVGKTLESYSKGKTTNALKSLMSLSPETANIIRDGKEINVGIDEVVVGDIFVVKAGESIPVDGVIVKGECSVDESALTGESIPVDKLVGQNVSAATISKSGYIECKAVSVGQDTAISKIIKMVEDASSTKAPIAKIADKVSSIFVPAVITIALVTFVCWLLSGQTIGFALARGISVLVISCPCALGLATPVAIMVGSGKGAKNGILFKSAESLEIAGKTDIVCLDKTGTITKGNPSVTDILSLNELELLKYAYAVESKSEHPLSKAIVNYCEEKNIELLDVTEFKTLTGKGVSCKIGSDLICAGNYGFINSVANIDEKYKNSSHALAQNGKTPLYFSKNNEFIGVIAVADTVKEDSKEAVSNLKKMGVFVVMVTGDNEDTANAIASEVNIDNVIAKVLPNEKEQNVRLLSNYGKVSMVGDGINDAPALTRADTGIAIGAGTDVAIDAADVVLMKNDSNDIPRAINLSRKVITNIKENLFWAFIYNIIGIPVAAGILYPAFGISLNPMIAAAAMSLSSFCVVCNALRLNFVNINKFNYKKSKRKEIDMSIFKKNNKPYVVIEGMMCAHCEAHVVEALKEIGLTVVADHSKNRATIENGEIDEAKIKEAVEKAGYKFIEIKK